ncbi:hypothetical protein E2C01_082673 [Portunus trituberculatus]|uniref:Uncharacterized protein n=1 Tax=Portunus trituberculatus TaxID=210409 RepID=A0A5B7IZR7_PORTR|nr:hypothetical protein [Portunus trituberculatus]
MRSSTEEYNRIEFSVTYTQTTTRSTLKLPCYSYVIPTLISSRFALPPVVSPSLLSCFGLSLPHPLSHQRRPHTSLQFSFRINSLDRTPSLAHPSS